MKGIVEKAKIMSKHKPPWCSDVVSGDISEPWGGGEVALPFEMMFPAEHSYQSGF